MNDMVKTIEGIVKQTNALSVAENIKAQLIDQLGDIASKLPEIEQDMATARVTDQDSAKMAVDKESELAGYIKTVTTNDILDGIIKGLHGMHRNWTGFRNEFLNVLEDGKKSWRRKRIAWEDAERNKAAEEQARLQAEEDARAAKEREKLLSRAETAKKPETQERLTEQADMVQAAQIRVEAPVTGGKRREVWKVVNVDQAAFFAALSTDATLRGFVELKQTALERAKAANPMMMVAGIEFKKVAQ